MEHAFGPAAIRIGRQLEHHAGIDIARAAQFSHAIKIPGTVEDEASMEGIPSIHAVEAVEHGFSPASVRVGRKFEDSAHSVCTAITCCAVEISRGVEDEPRLRHTSIRTLESM